MALLHEEDDHNHKDKTNNKVQRTDTPEKAHPTGEFVIVARFGGHVLHHLASRLVNVIRQGGRGQTKNLVLVIF